MTITVRRKNTEKRLNMKAKKEEKDNKKHVRKKKKSKNVLVITAVYVICFSIAAGFFAYTRINKYEEGIFEVCATQQDAYVQLVLDQINLKSNRDDEQIINDILKTMNSSSNKYWTFSKNQSILFVKDVLETNRYKGVTTATYYESDSAAAFLNNLQTDRVTHGYIDINGSSYVASGVAFEYKNQSYKLCLLTGRSAIMDNNSYLQIKIQMETYIVVLLLVLIVTAMLLAHSMRKLQKKLNDSENTTAQLNQMITKMNKKLLEKDLHDTRNNVWDKEAIMPFMYKIIKRDIYPVTFMHISCVSMQERDKFVARANYILDKNVLRFIYDDTDIVLVFLGINKRHARQNLQLLVDNGTQIAFAYSVKGKADVDRLGIKYAVH